MATQPAYDRAASEARSARRFADSKIYDVAAALPLIVIYAAGISVLALLTASELSQLLHEFRATTAVLVAMNVVTIAFSGLQIALFIVRRLPEQRAAGFWPRASAIVGSNGALIFLFLPRAHESPALLVASTLVAVVGFAASIIVAATLGRSFSILPQARKLVINGPYRWVRHPLYLAQLITISGLMWQFVQPWAFLIACVTAAMQFPRMHYEERILAETYPPYRAYMARTKRLIPGIY
jgi:protein-S-isoprenylcysteine O-methyltransferase Ste14